MPPGSPGFTFSETTKLIQLLSGYNMYMASPHCGIIPIAPFPRCSKNLTHKLKLTLPLIQTRHKKSLLPKKESRLCFQKAPLSPVKVNRSFFTNSSASSAARLSFPGIHGIGEHDTLTEAGPCPTDPRLCAPRFPGVYLFGNSENNTFQRTKNATLSCFTKKSALSGVFKGFYKGMLPYLASTKTPTHRPVKRAWRTIRRNLLLGRERQPACPVFPGQGFNNHAIFKAPGTGKLTDCQFSEGT